MQKKTFTKWINKHLVKVTRLSQSVDVVLNHDWFDLCPAAAAAAVAMTVCDDE